MPIRVRANVVTMTAGIRDIERGGPRLWWAIGWLTRTLDNQYQAFPLASSFARLLEPFSIRPTNLDHILVTPRESCRVANKGRGMVTISSEFRVDGGP